MDGVRDSISRAAGMDPIHRSELDLLTSFLGVPGYVLSTFLPNIQQLVARQPRLVKAMCILIALSTFGSTLFEKIQRALLAFMVRNFMFSTTIDASDPLYSYVIRWLKKKRNILPEQQLQARSKEEAERNQGYHSPSRGLPPAPVVIETKPGEEVIYDFNGLQVFWHKYRPFFVSPFPSRGLGPASFLTVRCFGFSSRPLKEIIEEAWKLYRQNDHARLTAVYRPVARSGGWRCVARRNRRSLDTIVLDPTEKNSLLEDVKFYLSGEAKDWYAARGIPYRRGYLFHGKPGTGKTSLSMAIAGQFGLDIYIVSLLDPHINDTFLHTFFTNLPKGALILLEDIDSAGLARETFDKSVQSYRRGRYRYRNDQSSTRVTLSGLLNAIDGADSPEGHLLIMTTNVPDALDEALVRPGRIDYKIGFKAISPPQAEAIFIRMYGDDVLDKAELDKMAKQFSEIIPDDTFTPAELQGHLLRHKKQPQEALDNLAAWRDGILSERQKLEDARKKEEDRRKRKKEARKAKRKSRQHEPPSVTRILEASRSRSKSHSRSQSRSRSRSRSVSKAGSRNGSDGRSGSGSDSDSTTSNSLMLDGLLPPPPPPPVDLGYDEDEPYYSPSTLNGDPTYADRNYGLDYIDPVPPDDWVSPPRHRRYIRRRSPHRSNMATWNDLDGKERTCAVM